MGGGGSADIFSPGASSVWNLNMRALSATSAGALDWPPSDAAGARRRRAPLAAATIPTKEKRRGKNERKERVDREGAVEGRGGEYERMSHCSRECEGVSGERCSEMRGVGLSWRWSAQERSLL